MVFKDKLGTFSFDNRTPVSIAKVIRDNVTGQWFNPKPQSPPLRTVQDAYDFVSNDSCNVVNGVMFKLELA